MNKTGLKTFVFSFGLTLSTILGVDRAMFYTPEPAKEIIKIPRKNITLFFNQTRPIISSSFIEPVEKQPLKKLNIQSDEVKIAQNIPELSSLEIISEDTLMPPENEEIPLIVEEIEEKPEQEAIFSDKEIDKQEDQEVPLVYAGSEKNVEPLRNAQKEIEENQSIEEVLPIQIASAEDMSKSSKEDMFDVSVEDNSENIPLAEGQQAFLEVGKPLVIQGTRQIIKIDNTKKYKEEKQPQQEELQNTPRKTLPDIEIVKEQEEIPLQNNRKLLTQENEKSIPESNQIASMGEEIPLVEAEEQIIEETKDNRQWQTMSEKHQDQNPWLVAKGSKFVKNKKILEDNYSPPEKGKRKEGLLPVKKTEDVKTTKLAVQDNLLIPIPQELLDEDDLIPDLGDNKEPKKSKLFEKKEEKEKSFIDNITSVFSKENREKAIQNLKKKSKKLVGKITEKEQIEEDVRQQILPTEIRLSFQPNRAEISGQTLRWVQAFAKKVVDDNSVGLEIRIDGSRSFELQQKRLNLLYNILTINGVPYQKINTVFVDREPNSFVVRTVKILNGEEEKKEDDSWKQYYQKW